MKNVFLYIVFVLVLLTATGCDTLEFPKVTHCTILSNGCICTDSFGNASFPEHKCVDYDAFSNEDYDKMQQWGLDIGRRLKKCEMGGKASAQLNVNLLGQDQEKTCTEENPN